MKSLSISNLLVKRCLFALFFTVVLSYIPKESDRLMMIATAVVSSRINSKFIRKDEIEEELRSIKEFRIQANQLRWEALDKVRECSEGSQYEDHFYLRALMIDYDCQFAADWEKSSIAVANLQKELTKLFRTL